MTPPVPVEKTRSGWNGFFLWRDNRLTPPAARVIIPLSFDNGRQRTTKRTNGEFPMSKLIHFPDKPEIVSAARRAARVADQYASDASDAVSSAISAARGNGTFVGLRARLIDAAAERARRASDAAINASRMVEHAERCSSEVDARRYAVAAGQFRDVARDHLSRVRELLQDAANA